MPYLRLKPLTAFLFSLPLLGGVSSVYAADAQPKISHYKNYHDGALTSLTIDKSTQLDGTYGFKEGHLFTVRSDSDQEITISGSGLTVDALPINPPPDAEVPGLGKTNKNSMFVIDNNVVFNQPVVVNGSEDQRDQYVFLTSGIYNLEETERTGWSELPYEVKKPLLWFKQDLSIVMPKLEKFPNTLSAEPAYLNPVEIWDPSLFANLDTWAFSDLNVKTEGNVYVKAGSLLNISGVHADQPWHVSMEGRGKTIELDLRVLVQRPSTEGSIEINKNGGARVLMYNTVIDTKTKKQHVMPMFLRGPYPSTTAVNLDITIDTPGSKAFLYLNGYDNKAGEQKITVTGKGNALELRACEIGLKTIPPKTTIVAKDDASVILHSYAVDAYSRMGVSFGLGNVQLNGARFYIKHHIDRLGRGDFDKYPMTTPVFMHLDGQGKLRIPMYMTGRNFDIGDAWKLSIPMRVPFINLFEPKGNYELQVDVANFHDIPNFKVYVIRGTPYNDERWQLYYPDEATANTYKAEDGFLKISRAYGVNALYRYTFDVTQEYVNFSDREIYKRNDVMNASQIIPMVTDDPMGYFPMLWGLTNPKKLDPATQPTDLVETLMGLESNNLTILSAMNDTLYDRLGDLHAQRAQEKKQALWVRTKWTQSQRNGLFGYKASNQMVEVGVDRAFKRSNGKWYGGVMAQFQRSNFKNDHTNAHGQLMNFGLYASYLADSDWYLDLVGRFGQYKPGKQPIDVADQDIPNARHLEPTSSSGSNILNASVELGRRFVLKQQYFVEPQAQLDYAVMGSRHFTLKEDLDDGHTNIWEGKTHPTKSLLGRVGVALGKTWFDSWKTKRQN